MRRCTARALRKRERERSLLNVTYFMTSNPTASTPRVVHTTHKYHKQSAHTKCQSGREFIVESSESLKREDVKVEIAAFYHRVARGTMSSFAEKSFL